jgi:hypothetical protein
MAIALFMYCSCAVGYSVGHECASPAREATSSLCSLPSAIAAHVDEGFRAWMGSFGSHPEAAQEHLRKSGRIMLVGSSLSLVCMLVAMSCPWAVVENPAVDSSAQIYLWVYYGARLRDSFQSFYPPGGDPEPQAVALAVDSLATVSGIASAVLTLSLVTQLLAFVATVRTWAALNRWQGAIRVCAREAALQLNAATFLMMIFCACTYLSGFNRVTAALGTSGSPSNALQPGFWFALSAALLSLLSLLMVAGCGFRKAWRVNVAGEVGATAPLLVAGNTPRVGGGTTTLTTEPTTTTTASGAEKPLPRHLVRELLEVAESKETECPVCLDKITATTGQYTACGHLFCKTCLEELEKEKQDNHRAKPRCPTCRAVL